jgi:hypothetical protein
MKTNKKHNAGDKKLRSELMWVIYGTRKEMIEKHRAALGQTWDYCRKRGDRAVKVWVMPLAKYVR